MRKIIRKIKKAFKALTAPIDYVDENRAYCSYVNPWSFNTWEGWPPTL